jgi:hypothetical protein
MHNSGKSAPSPSTHLLFGILLAALLLLRQPASLLRPQFWAEDGTLFFQDAFNHGFWSTILQPAAGYLHTFPRLVAGVSLLFPMEQAPLVFSLAAFVVQLAPALYLLSPRMSGVIPAFWARAAAALLYVAVPASSETYANLTNAHWHLALIVVCLLVARPAEGAAARGFEALTVALFAVTGPFSILFLPLVAPRLFRARAGAPRERGLTPAILIVVGAAIQALIALTSARVGAGAARFELLSPGELMTAVSTHAFFNATLGIRGLVKLHGFLPPAAYGLGLLGLLLLAFVTVRDRVGPLLVLLYLAALSIALCFAFPLTDPRLLLDPNFGSRYFLFAALFVLFSLLRLALSGPPLRGVGLALLAVAVAVGIPGDFFHSRKPDTLWAENAAVFASLPAGADFSIPVLPLFHPPLVLHKKTPPGGPSPLARFRAVPSRTPASFILTRPERVTLNESANTRHLLVAGWATDGTVSRPAGGVFVEVDGRLFPAAYGLQTSTGLGGDACRDCGFSRLIPISEIGPGPGHTVSIIVLTANRVGQYQPLPRLPFTLSQFFP